MLKEWLKLRQKQFEEENADGSLQDFVPEVIDLLIEREDKLSKVYREANNILWFDDSSDYCGALWDILRIINPELEEYPELKHINEEGEEEEDV